MDRVRVAKWTGAGLLLAALLFVAWKWSGWRAHAQAGSAYAARITCSCRYIEGRSAKSCARDIEEDASLVFVSERPEEKLIIGRVPLMGRAAARFTPGYGCLMQPEPGR